ncbi:carotenoid ester lipase precursor [Obba rivulosa]|uniref:Carboxylic ester hydrolase n=1 Tax=Obba rivulosa TaxID=1052685 RepID=A0A8E2B2I8_9APHY|nr:carotenoid ester lipase precursor [Obba rivulosa]
MLIFSYILLTYAFAIGSANAVPSHKPSADLPTVVLDNATFIGSSDGAIDKFFGISFALPPTGNLRFRLPEPAGPYNGTHNATNFGLSCPQQSQDIFQEADIPNLATALGIPREEPAPGEGEDCESPSYVMTCLSLMKDTLGLNLNVWAPSGAQSNANLSVFVVRIIRGFEDGSNSADDGGTIVQRSIELGEPIIYVSMNYRHSAFGFLASKEVEDAGVGNLGLWDQRQALRWVQKYIGVFGGNATRVTIGGESAGAMSTALQMVTNGGNTEGLFRGAFMSSGAPIPVGNITHGQKYYDALVDETGCAGEADTLECLRNVPYDELKAAVDKSPNQYSTQALNLAWLPRTDGKFLTAPPLHLVLNGSVANVPFINGNCDDEGTAFSLPSALKLDIQTDDQFVAWMTETYFPTVPENRLNELFTLYPDDPAQGSPFDTGNRNRLTRQYKRMAALQGDLGFQAPRRFFLQQRSGKQDSWAYLFKGKKSTPFLGSYHSSDVPSYFGPGDLTDYLINFVNHLDPNGRNVEIEWPKYDNTSLNLLTLTGNSAPYHLNITLDDFRVDGMNLLTNLSLDYPL